MSAADDYKVWIGCLGCYNGGNLVGRWFDADEIPEDHDEWADGHSVPGSHYAEAHEELWVMDHEGGMIEGEYGVTTARDHAEFLESVDDYDAGMFRAWVKYQGITPDADALSEAQDAYSGHYESDEDFAMEMADSLGLIQENAGWPYSSVDWERAARELMMDYFSEDGHYFRA